MRIDPLFGELHSSPARNGPLHLWVAKGVFPPTAAEVEYQFQAPADGPTEEQRGLLDRIHRKYAEFGPVALQMVAGFFAQQNPDQDVIEAAGLKLVSLYVPTQEDLAMEWDLTYKVEETGEEFMVDMRGWKPVSVTDA